MACGSFVVIHVARGSMRERAGGGQDTGRAVSVALSHYRHSSNYKAVASPGRKE